jgi:uncharacterized protein YegP (UPF0339 family)
MVFHMYQDMVGNWRWYLAAPNDVKLAIAPVGYARRGDCIHAINRVREGIDAPIIYDNYGPVAHVHSAIVVGTTASA